MRTLNNRESCESASTRVARHIIATLIDCGVRTFIVCPGSRSAPFAYALYDADRAGAITLHVETDERVAAFVALGCGLAGTLAACVTTSGSAVANLHPAVEEAYHSCVPMILLTADRPYELHGCRANQTTDQRSVLSGSVRYCLEIPAEAPADAALAGLVARSVRAAQGAGYGSLSGPVQINCGLRPPLTPDSSWLLPSELLSAELSQPKPGSRIVLSHESASEPSGESASERAPATVVIAASSTLGEHHYSPAVLSALQHVPILAEPSSPLRALPSAICGYVCALHTPLREAIERVIVIGHPTLTREISDLLADERVSVYVVDEPPTYADATGRATVISLNNVPLYAQTPRRHLEQWLRASESAKHSSAQIVQTESQLSWVHIAHALIEHSPMPVHIGASSIVRELNTYGWQAFAGGATANRGLAGIDGTLSTARGLSLAYGAPVRVCLGDVAFIYDMSALVPIVGQHDANIDVVVVDDGGGSLFSMLEYGKSETRIFDRLFRTGREIDLRAYAQACGAAYTCVSSYGELCDALDQPLAARNRIVHVRMLECSAGQMRAQRERHANILTEAITRSVFSSSEGLP